jgi:hypothetical protein
MWHVMHWIFSPWLDKLKKIIMVLTEGLLDVNIVNRHDV